MQRIISATKTFLGTQIPKSIIVAANFSMFENGTKNKLLPACVPIMNFIAGFKVKGRVKRRCKSCYFVNRQERLYVICPEHPRHKQMAKKPKPHNTWILTHASQSKVRPWSPPCGSHYKYKFYNDFQKQSAEKSNLVHNKAENIVSEAKT